MMIASAPVSAQAQNGEDESSASKALEEIVVTGSRFGGRVSTDSLTPIDSISAEDLTKRGATEMQDLLKVSVPSFSTARPMAAGVQDYLTPPTLRGLSPGHVLLLVNGKRRHTNSELNVQNQIGRGDVSYDFNAIPSAAIGRAEVLRDGASAQYGSDAIAGVINLQLNDQIGTDISVTSGQTSEGDGEKVQASVGSGVEIGDEGFIRVTLQHQSQEMSNRALPDTRQQYFGDNGTTMPSGSYGSGTGLTPSNGELDPREATIDRDLYIFGQPEYDNTALFINSESTLDNGISVFGFGGYNRLEGSGAGFFRRAGQDQNVRAIYPDGFLPMSDTTLKNMSASLGVRGDDVLGFEWELSSTYGKGITDRAYSNTLNPSYGVESPTSGDIGSTRFSQWTNNLDLVRDIQIADSSPLMLAFGMEYRKEIFEMVAGEPVSYSYGGVDILDGPNAGNTAGVGFQPSAGTQLSEELTEGRHSYAVYGELEKDFFERLTLSAAARYEDFSDFGDTTDFRLAGRFEINEILALRGSFGTGFRAPALAQSFFQKTATDFATGVPVVTRVVSVNDPVAELLGAESLKPEEAETLSIGAVAQYGDFTASIDFYNIDIDDRIVISSNFYGDALTELLANNGYSGVAGVSYLTNAVDTTTQGVDVTVSHSLDMGNWGTLRSTLTANYNDTEFDAIADAAPELTALGITTDLFDLRQQVRVADSTPKAKASLNFDWSLDRLGVSLTATYYGEVSDLNLQNKTQEQVEVLTRGYDVKVYERDNGNFDVLQTFGAKIVTDLSLRYDVTDELRISGGVDNLFDIYPDRQIASTVESVAVGTNGADNNGIFPYSYVSPFGTNGRYAYLKLDYSF